MVETIFQNVETSHGFIATEMTRGNGHDVVFIHGNSSSREVFHKQFHSDLFKSYRLISFDLPGHGASGDAVKKTSTYPLPGLADATLELFERLNVRTPVLVGWSLGGHIAMELMSRKVPLSGIFITGSPPVGAVISEGFRGNLLSGLASKGQFVEQEVSQFAKKVFGNEPSWEDVIRRTDPEFRSILFSAERRGEKSDQRAVVGSTSIPTAMVNGADDPIVNLDYIDQVPYGNLWKKMCLRVARSEHAPFLQNPTAYNALLAEFLADVFPNALQGSNRVLPAKAG